MIETAEILYPVEKIVDKRLKRGKVEYLVRWKHYSPDTDSWEPARSLKATCHTLIKNFNDALRIVNNQNSPSNISTNILNSSPKCSETCTTTINTHELSSRTNSAKTQNSNLISKSIIKVNGCKEPIISSDTTLSEMSNEKRSDTDTLESVIKGKSKACKKTVLYLDDNSIDEPSLQNSQSLKLKSVSSDDFSPNSICTFNSDQYTKISSPRTTFNSMLTEKIINHIEENSKSNELKRKISTNQNDNVKKLKIFDKNTKPSGDSSGDRSIDDLPNSLIKIDNNEHKPVGIKSSDHRNGFNITEMKLNKGLKRLPYHRHKDSENVESVDGLIMRRKSARQMKGSNQFREIIVRKNIEAGYTEISLYNNRHSFPNCFTFKILNELSAALLQAINDSSRVLLLSSVGKVFSSGLDLESIINNVPTSLTNFKNSRYTTAQLTNPLSHDQYLQDLAESLKRFLLQLLNFPKPIVVGVNGPAIGLGCAILPLCDLIYATESSSFYLPYSSLSQFPEGGTSVTLSMLIGMPAANQLLLGGRRWSAREALNRGLISEIIFSEKFKVELFSRCKKLANVPSMSLETMKCMLRFQYKERIEHSINLECKKLLDMWRTSEFQNSAQHFIEKELPHLLS